MHNRREEAVWLQDCLSSAWGMRSLEGRPRPLQAPEHLLSLGSTLWLIESRERLVAKVLVNRDHGRHPRFAALRDRVIGHCAAAGVPVVQPIPTRDGSPRAHVDGRQIELMAFADGAAWGADEGQLNAVADAIFLLRAALDGVPATIAEQLRDVPLRLPVEQPDPRRARQEAIADLLPLARRQRDPCGDLVRTALEAVAAAPSELIDCALDAEASREDCGIIHGDLHRGHILLSAVGAARVTAILDFDNLRIGPRDLDLAWLADQSARRGARDGGFRTAAAVGCIGRAVRHGVLRPERCARVMTPLIAYAIPIVVDIAKDILVRDDRQPIWARYLDLLDVGRMLAVHRAVVRTFAS